MLVKIYLHVIGSGVNQVAFHDVKEHVSGLCGELFRLGCLVLCPVGLPGGPVRSLFRELGSWIALFLAASESPRASSEKPCALTARSFALSEALCAASAFS